MQSRLKADVCASGHALRWHLEELASTPSREVGVTEKAERDGRFEACNFARNVIRTLFGDERALETTCNQAQMVACYYLQLFYMFNTLMQEDLRLVAAASAFLACKMVDLPRKMRCLLRTLNQLRVKDGEAEVGEEEQKRMCERILGVEFMLLRIVRFDVDPTLPLEELAGLSDHFLAGLTHNAIFQRLCAGKPPVQEANALRPELLRVAERFTLDSFMGLAPLMAPPRLVAAASLAIATRFTRRQLAMRDLTLILVSADRSFNEQELKAVIDEILNVFRTKKGKEATSPTPAMPHTGTPSSASTVTPSAAQSQDNVPGTNQPVRISTDEAQVAVVDTKEGSTSRLPANAVLGSSTPKEDSSSAKTVAASAQLVESSNAVTWKAVRTLQHADRCHPYLDSPSRRGSSNTLWGLVAS